MIAQEASNDIDEQGSNGAIAAPEKQVKLDLVDRLDQLQWYLDDIDMKDDDRFEIDYYLGCLLKDVVDLASKRRKKKKGMMKRFKRLSGFCWKRGKGCVRRFSPIQRTNDNKEEARLPKDPILPFVVYIPTSSLCDDASYSSATVLDDMPHKMASLRPHHYGEQEDNDAAVLYYLQDEAYMTKAPTFFETLRDDRHKQRQQQQQYRKHHKRTPTAETIRMDASYDVDLYQKIDDSECFSDLITGIEEEKEKEKEQQQQIGVAQKMADKNENLEGFLLWLAFTYNLSRQFK